MIDLKDIKFTDIDTFSFVGYEGECKVVDIYDGDTCYIVFVLDGKITKCKIRLSYINAPEINTENGIKSRNRLIELFLDDKLDNTHHYTRNEIREILGNIKKLSTVKLHNFDKYGRILGEIFLDNNKEKSVNTILLDEGFAVEYK